MRCQSRHLAYVMLIASVISLTSCHANKASTNKYVGDVESTSNDAPTEKLFTELVSTYKPWTDLYVPVELALESPKKFSISGRATMIYGKEINISLRFLGMEVGYVYVNETKVYVVDKYHKYYFSEDISNLVKDYGIGITDLQDLLLGRAVMPGTGRLTESDKDKFSFLSSDQQWIMTPKKGFDGADWHYIATKSQPPMLSAMSLRAGKSMAMECRFAEPTNTDAGIVDGITTITLPIKNDNIKVSITWRLNDAKWNSGREIKFNPPSSSYHKLDVESLLKSMSTE